MDKPNQLDRKSLQSELENYKLIVEVNSELLDENLSARDELAKNVELAQNCIDKSHQWEASGDRAKSNEELSSAQIIIVEINTVIKYLLSLNTSLDDRYLQEGQISVCD